MIPSAFDAELLVICHSVGNDRLWELRLSQIYSESNRLNSLLWRGKSQYNDEKFPHLE